MNRTTIALAAAFLLTSAASVNAQATGDRGPIRGFAPTTTVTGKTLTAPNDPMKAATTTTTKPVYDSTKTKTAPLGPVAPPKPSKQTDLIAK